MDNKKDAEFIPRLFLSSLSIYLQQELEELHDEQLLHDDEQPHDEHLRLSYSLADTVLQQELQEEVVVVVEVELQHLLQHFLHFLQHLSLQHDEHERSCSLHSLHTLWPFTSTVTISVFCT